MRLLVICFSPLVWYRLTIIANYSCCQWAFLK
nr:MAG TPA_asm: hypothetical protein [Caudoviricetes sp.]